MNEDAIGKTFELAALAIFLFFTLRPDWSIKILSYGKADVHDMGRSGLLVMRSLAIFCTLGLFVDLVRSFFKN
jgi:hypothetical protein